MSAAGAAGPSDRVRAELVLVGGGHAHVQVLRGLAMRPLPGVRVTLVVDRAEAVYSGMVPAFVAGECTAEALTLDTWPLARRARARVVEARALAVDPVARRIAVEGRPPLAYDVASLDVGSTVRGHDLPGVAEHALATRPIQRFVERLDAALAGGPEAGAPRRILVVGGGAAGLELLFTLDARLRAAGRAAELLLAAADAMLLPGASRRMARAALREAGRRGLGLRTGLRVTAVDAGGAWAEGSQGCERLDADLVVWAAGAAPPALVRASALARDGEGFVRIRDTLEVVDAPDLFAAGDCAVPDAHPWVPRAGVYAVRQGPVLARNLRARLTGRPLAAWRPQRDFLALLNLGGGRALGGKWGLVARGRPVGWLKERIDRRFVRRFRVVLPDGRPGPGLPAPEAMGMEPMVCGGCAAKVAPDALRRALGRLAPAPADPGVVLGLDAADDAAAWRLPDGALLLASLDGFRAFCDDPFLVGRVAALNALSDVWAKGGAPRHALALVTVPHAEAGRAEEVLFQALAGIRVALDAHGVTLLGGHSTLGEDLFVGLCVTGSLPADAAPLRLAGARPGDRLVLAKALGTGVVLAADAVGRAPAAWARATHAALQRPSDAAARVARAHGARAATDVTGFGLAGHLEALLRASGVSATLAPAAVPALPGALALLAAGVRSTFHPASGPARDAVAPSRAWAGRPELELLFDPQTAGGLLLAFPPEQADAAVGALHGAGDADARVVGEVGPAPGPGAAPIVLADPDPARGGVSGPAAAVGG